MLRQKVSITNVFGNRYANVSITNVFGNRPRVFTTSGDLKISNRKTGL